MRDSTRPRTTSPTRMGERESSETNNPPRVLAFPLPKQGHINPLLQFSKRLASRAVHVTLLIPSSLAHSLHVLPNSRSVQIALVPDADSDPNVTSERFKAAIAKGFEDFVASNSDSKPSLVIYDSLMPWILPVANRLGLDGAPFFTQSCAVNHIYDLIGRGDLEIPVAEGGRVSVASLPILDAGDLPISFPGVGLGFVKSFKASQFGNLEEAKWMLCNTFYELESAVLFSIL